jgi:hypothetical protein
VHHREERRDVSTAALDNCIVTRFLLRIIIPPRAPLCIFRIYFCWVYYTLDTANVPAHESFSSALACNRPIRPCGRIEFAEAEKRGISLRQLLTRSTISLLVFIRALKAI